MAAAVEDNSPILIPGSDYLAKTPGFELIGRKEELDTILDVLLRKNTGNNLILNGKYGVGLSSLVLGLQAKQHGDDVPLALATKSFYFLDVDALFSSNNMNAIGTAFEKALKTLEQADEPVLVINDTKGFLDGMRNSGASNLMNLLMRSVKASPRFQVIFEAADATLGDLLAAHSDIAKLFTRRDVEEPKPDDLHAIIDRAAEKFSKQYGVNVSKGAVDAVMDLTRKYPGLTLDLAQPKRGIAILEGALAAYCRTARARPAELDDLEARLAAVTAAIENSGVTAAIDADKGRGDLAGKTPQQLAGLKLEIENTIEEVTTDWTARKGKLHALRNAQSQGLQGLQEFDNEIAAQKKKEDRLRQARKAYHDAETEEQRKLIKDDYRRQTGETLAVGKENTNKFNDLANIGLAESEEIECLKNGRKELENEIEKSKRDYADLLREMNGGDLSLTDEHVLAEFSRLSRVPANKLKQDESQKLRHLADTLKQRVFGQDEPIEAIAKAVKRGRVGLKKPNKPIGSFMFLGPSGVGKTELAKALATTLFGDETALQIYNMSEYMEKHASAVLIGAPPGYEGHAEGGLLTNNMRRMPSCVNLFDEVEKADKQVFDLFLQIVDEGVLVDRRGVKASFANSINILTSNIGAKYFLDKSLTFEEAKEKALADLWNPAGDPNDPQGKGFRPEFLNRFTGIFCFNRLGEVEIIKIANKSLKELNNWVAENGISVSMPEKDLKAMCEEQYDPRNGGRGIMNYIENSITSDVAETLLEHPNTPGTVEVTYTPSSDKNKREKAKVGTTFMPRKGEAAQTAPPSNEEAANENDSNKNAAQARKQPKKPKNG